MSSALVATADYSIIGFPAVIPAALIPFIGIAIVSLIIYRRLIPLLRAAPDDRFNRITERISIFLKIWLVQYRQPRYLLAGILHIGIFFGFLILAVRTISLVFIGIYSDFGSFFFDSDIGHIYNTVKDYAATIVLIACVAAAVRRGIFRPARYNVPEKYGHDHTAEAIFVLGIISTLMLSESLFEAALAVAESQKGNPGVLTAPATLVHCFTWMLADVSLPVLQLIHIISYFVHDIVFFLFLLFSSFRQTFSCNNIHV